MVGVESPAPTAAAARLAARGVRPRRVSAKRTWPPGCGRFPAPPLAPAAGDDGEKGADGAVEVRAEDVATPAVVSSAACNGALPHAPPQPEPERVVEEERGEGGEAQSPGDVGVPSSDGQGEGRVFDVMPLAFAAPRSCAVAATNGSLENGRDRPGSLLMEGKGGKGSGELVREEEATGDGDGKELGGKGSGELVREEEATGDGDGKELGGKGSGELVREEEATGDGDGREMGGGVGGGELERKEDGHDGGRKKRWLMSVVNPPPKRRAVSAIRRFPPGCGRAAVTLAGSRGEEGLLLKATPISVASGAASMADALATVPVSGGGASPLFGLNASNVDVEGKRMEDEGASKAHNGIQESQVANDVVPDDFAKATHDNAPPRNVVAKASPSHDFDERMNGKRSPHEGKRIARVVGDGKVRSKCEGILRGEGTPETPIRGHVGVKAKGKRLDGVNMNKALLDDAEASGEGKMRSKTLSTQRGVVRSISNMKQDKAAHKLKPVGIGKDTLHRSAEESKFGKHVVTNQTENDGLDLVTDKLIVQALMAPDKCPWTQGRKSIASVTQSLTPRNKLKKKDATPRKELQKDATSRKELPPKVAPSKLTKHEAIEDHEDPYPEDDGNSKALVVHEGKNETCGTLPSCAPFGYQGADARSKVRKLLKLFHGICRRLKKVEEKHIRSVGRIDIEAVNAVKKSPIFTKLEPIVGHVPGVEVGDEFHFRVELSIVGLHRPYQAGIDTTKEKNGVPIAISIVASGGYPDELSSSDELIYTGSGGKAIGKKEAEDQKLERGNLALKNCIETKTPVRVIHGFKGQSRGEAGHSKTKQMSTFTYDGLYMVVDCWQEGPKGSMVFKYKLQRIPGQPELALHIVKATRKSKIREGLCLPDISQGSERIPICVINTIDGMQPEPFKYITKVIYPRSYAKEPPKGCDCTNGCSDSDRCACAVKNGREIPFDFSGAIVHAKPLIYECGPSCRCPPTCHNRVSQHGVKIPLEIFKTGKTGWGVRSLSSISSGSFVCEYAGELLQDKEAKQRQNDEYLFHIGHNYDDEDLWKELPSIIPGLESSTSETMEGDVGFTIDAAKCGNVGRFINHSCSPNLYAKNVLWDHDDKRMPHIMFFAAENIRPLQELTYHYNYTIGQVHDNNGEEKVKHCCCGSSECCGRLY